MSILWPDGLPNRDRLGNPILTAFGNMLRLPVLAADDTLSEAEKTVMAAGLLYGRLPDGLCAEDALREVLWFFCCGQEPAKSDEPSLFDFEQDAELIYASFWQAYGIDLAVQRVHWWAFCALFRALGKETAMGRVMRLRAADPAGLPAARRAELQKWQRLFALEKQPKKDDRRGDLLEYAQNRYRQAAEWAAGRKEEG